MAFSCYFLESFQSFDGRQIRGESFEMPFDFTDMGFLEFTLGAIPGAFLFAASDFSATTAFSLLLFRHLISLEKGKPAKLTVVIFHILSRPTFALIVMGAVVSTPSPTSLFQAGFDVTRTSTCGIRIIPIIV